MSKCASASSVSVTVCHYFGLAETAIVRLLIFSFTLVFGGLLAGCSTYGDITTKDLVLGDPYTLAAKTDAIFKENWAYLKPAHFE